MSDQLTAVILGLVQGLTEFLPVSSTAHLILVSDALKLDPEKFGLSFDVALHIGTALAVLLYFAGTWIGLLLDVLRGRWRLPLVIIVGTIPAAIAGVLFETAVSTTLRGAVYIAIGLLVGSAIFVLAERVGSRTRRLDRATLVDAVIIGVAQAIALIPGISRSGITISAGLFRGLERGDATRLAFLLATPVILGAGVKTLLDARKLSGLTAQLDIVVIGFAVSFIAGLASVAFMVRYLRTHSLKVFVIYRVALAVVILVAVALGGLS
ncbi:MAG TPA: undecaprenyl-diphosphate phosphatase [Candidatus Limnocylindria bacterium]|nr:undecaprenyl-diphosphate phosphatase [Candidatus Limnocylindria bacterium]